MRGSKQAESLDENNGKNMSTIAAGIVAYHDLRKVSKMPSSVGDLSESVSYRISVILCQRTQEDWLHWSPHKASTSAETHFQGADTEASLA
jgi:CRISPR/Cas system CMR-associated protein Cmr1 (group 7 of RAMP superfamily)